MASATDKPIALVDAARGLAPGVALAALVSIAAVLLEPQLKALTGGTINLPAMVIALLIGIALNRVAARPLFEAGLTWCVKKLLRVAIALLGLRIAFGDIASLGLATGLLIVAAMVLTIVAGIGLARLFRRGDGYGALAGAAVAVCGASATLATATVVPDYPAKRADIAFTVVAANAVATIAMILYPPLCAALGFDAQVTGVMLGATIHDVAQVAGAGYAVSESAGNAAVIVKLFRVFLLLPVVLAVGWWFMKRGAHAGAASVPVPVFALVFLALAFVNSLAPLVPAVMPAYLSLKAALGLVSTWGLLLAISALGLGTSPTAILAIGWRHLAVFGGATMTILVFMTLGLALIK